MLSRQTETPQPTYVVSAYSLLGFLSATTFGLLQIFVEHTPSVGYLEIASGLVMLLNILAMRATHNVNLARSLFLATVISLLVVMLTSGGTQGTGVFWFFLFPVAAFFLTNKRQGMVWVGGLLAITILLWVLDAQGVIMLWYSDVTIRQLLVALTVVSVGIYVYEQSRERAYRHSDESQHDLQEFLDGMTTYSAKIDLDGTILFANKALKDAYGKHAQALGSNLLDAPWWAEDSVRQRVKDALQKAIAGTPVNYDERFQVETRDGHKDLTFAFSLMPVKGKTSTRYILAEARDISSEKMVDRAKSEFVTLASHQLRTPIAAIRWFSEMLLSGDAGKLATEQHDHVEQIYHSSQRMANLVDEMLLVSGLELGSLPITPEELDVSVFCRKVVNAQSRAVAEKRLVIKDHYDKHLTKLLLDPHILKIILRNLFVNAIKYTPAGGSISLEVIQTTKKLRPDSHGSLAIMVNDSGYGIPESAQQEIFSKFFRADNVKDKDTDGTGLGLYLVKMLLDYVGGTISFTSTENVGTTFVVELPLEGMTAYQPKISKDSLERKR
jgi:PAS domain S-box-containing protein